MSGSYEEFMQRMKQYSNTTGTTSAFVNKPIQTNINGTVSTNPLYSIPSLTDSQRSNSITGDDLTRPPSMDINFTDETPWYKDGNAMEGYAGLASSLMQAVALPGQLKLANVQRKGLEQNLKQAKTDSANKAVMVNNLANHRLGE